MNPRQSETHVDAHAGQIQNAKSITHTTIAETEREADNKEREREREREREKWLYSILWLECWVSMALRARMRDGIK